MDITWLHILLLSLSAARLTAGGCILPDSILEGLEMDDRNSYFDDGDELDLQCKRGHYFSSNGVSNGEYDTQPKKIRCIGKEWSQDLPRCVAFSCERPTQIRNGYIIPELEKYYEDDVIRYKCDDDYVLIGHPASTCSLEHSGWFFDGSICSPMFCPSPTIPRNGVLYSRDNRVGNTTRYACHRGYAMFGSKRQTCQRNGQWSGVKPTCNKDGIRPLPAVPNGGKYDEESEEIRYHCYGQAYVRGPQRRTWTPLGWSPLYDPVCERLSSFTDEKTLAEAFATLVTRFKKDRSTAPEQTAFSAYFLIDTSGSLTDEHHQLGIDFIEAILKEWDIEGGSLVGVVPFSTDAREEFGDYGGIMPVSGRTSDEIINKLKDITRKGADTNIAEALRYVSEEFMAKNPSPETTVFLLSDGEVTLGGHPIHEAGPMKMKGAEIYSLKLGTVTDARTESVLMDVSSSAEFPPHFPHYIKIQDEQALDAMVSTYENYTSVLTECGVSGDANFTDSYRPGGDSFKRSTWPWLMKIIVQSRDDLWRSPLCLGTLVSPEWVLTHADCISGKTAGSLGVKPAGFSAIQDQVSVDFISPEHDGIILLRLSRPLRLSPFVRPICLPEGGEEVLSAETHYVTFGWKTNEIDETQELRQAAVPSLDCPGDRERVKCAGFDTSEENDPSTCNGDIGSPLLVKSEMDADTAKIKWILVGVQRTGCPLSGRNFGMYESTQERIDWIRSTAY